MQSVEHSIECVRAGVAERKAVIKVVSYLHISFVIVIFRAANCYIARILIRLSMKVTVCTSGGCRRNTFKSGEPTLTTLTCNVSDEFSIRSHWQPTAGQCSARHLRPINVHLSRIISPVSHQP